MKYLDITFMDDGSMTIWLPISEDDCRECNVMGGRVDPYEVLDIARLVGESLVVRIIDPQGGEVSRL